MYELFMFNIDILALELTRLSITNDSNIFKTLYIVVLLEFRGNLFGIAEKP